MLNIVSAKTDSLEDLRQNVSQKKDSEQHLLGLFLGDDAGTRSRLRVPVVRFAEILRVCLLLARIKKYIALFEILQVIRKSLFGAFSQVSAVAMWQLLLSQLAEITQKSIFMLT